MNMMNGAKSIIAWNFISEFCEKEIWFEPFYPFQVAPENTLVSFRRAANLDTNITPVTLEADVTIRSANEYTPRGFIRRLEIQWSLS